jgi:hypothetical protein
MPISELAGAQSCNDFQQTECGGTKLLREFTHKISPISIHERAIFHFVPRISPTLGSFCASTAQNEHGRSYSYIQAHKTYACWQP